MAAAVTPPLTLGEILDRTIQLYRRNFLLFVGISLAPSACYVLLYGSTSLYISSHLAQIQTAPNMPAMLIFFAVITGFLLLGLPLLVAISSLSLSALNFAASQRNSQQTITVRDAYAYAWKRFWRYLGIFALQLVFAGLIPGAAFGGILVIGATSAAFLTTAAGGNQTIAIVVALLLVVLALALAAVMILIWLRFSLAFPASLVEDLKVWPSMQRSNRLSKGSRGRIFVMYLLVVILVTVVYYALTLPIDIVVALVFFKQNELMAMLSKPPLVFQVINLFIGFLQRAFVLPVYAIALLLFYNDQRTRQEGYDIELLMAQAGWSTSPSTPPLAAAPTHFQPSIPSPFPHPSPASTQPPAAVAPEEPHPSSGPSHPIATEQTTTEPITTEPIPTEPAAAEPATSEPPATHPFSPEAPQA